MNNNTEAVIIKIPSECTSIELKEFSALVLEGSEVMSDGLGRRIQEAKALVFLRQDDVLKGIAAVKNPGHDYKNAVFRKAQASVDNNRFPFELGWVFVVPSSRGVGFSHILVKAALAATSGQGIFATTRSDNVPIHKVLKAHGIFRNGNTYVSSRGNQQLMLFVRNAAQAGDPVYAAKAEGSAIFIICAK